MLVITFHLKCIILCETLHQVEVGCVDPPKRSFQPLHTIGYVSVHHLTIK